MEKILVATKNRDKFTIVVDIFRKLGLRDYEFVNLHDLGITDEIEEVGSIIQRAEQKAIFYAGIINRQPAIGVRLVVGIDDGIKLPNDDKASPNSKEITRGILSGQLVKKGDIIWIVRSFVIYVAEDGNVISSMTQIPFSFLGNSKNVSLEDEKYPLSLVLGMMNDFRPIAEISSEESSKYYLKYSEYPLREMFAKCAVARLKT